LWGANWIFAGNQIHFVQLRIRAARAATFSEKFDRGWFFFLAQLVFLGGADVRIALAGASSFGDYRFRSRTRTRNEMVLSKTGISGWQKPRLV
jgi:hypothetical protein